MNWTSPETVIVYDGIASCCATSGSNDTADVDVWSQYTGDITGEDYGSDLLFQRRDRISGAVSPIQYLNAGAPFSPDRSHLTVDVAPLSDGGWSALWWATWLERSEGGLTNSFCLARSTDDGKTWSPYSVLPNPGFEQFRNAIAAHSPSGTSVILSLGFEMFGGEPSASHYRLHRLTGFGSNWEATVELGGPYPYYYGNFGYGSALDTDGQGNWVVMTVGRDGNLDEDDILFRKSTDDGATWSDPVSMTPDIFHWPPRPEERTPPNKNQVAVSYDGRGRWLAVWNQYRWTAPEDYGIDDLEGVFGAVSTDAGETWSEPKHILPERYRAFERSWRVDLQSDRKGRWLAAWRTYPAVPENQTGPSLLLVSHCDDFDSTPRLNEAALECPHPPARLAPGVPARVEAIVWNRGETPWSCNGALGYKLALTSEPATLAAWGIGTPRINLPEDVVVPPGGSHRFSIDVNPPGPEGPLTLKVRMVSEHVEFFGEELEIRGVVENFARANAFWEAYE